jgi:hypothetical protein
MSFWLLSLCSKIWSLILWYSLHWSFCSGLFCLFVVFYTSIWIFGFFFLLWWRHWNFDSDCIESVVAFGIIPIFTILILSIHEYGTYFHLLMSSISYCCVL